MLRAPSLFFLLLSAFPARPQGSVLINEVQPANGGTITDASGRHADWIELYNTGTKPVDLLGMRLSIAGRTQMIDASLIIPAQGHLLLWCDGRPRGGPDHLGFTLPRSGGTLLLIAADGSTILDVFTWPAMDTDISMGRLPDGAKGWSFFERPTPGSANTAEAPVRGRAAAPVADMPAGHHPGPVTVALRCGEGAEVYYTLDGSAPVPGNAKRYEAPLAIGATAVLRARAHAPGMLPSEELRATYVIGRREQEGVSLALAPADLFGDSGIYEPGTRYNHTRGGRDWERTAVVSLPGMDGAMVPVGARISGSGSRGLAKRSFKLYARKGLGSPGEGLPFPDGTRFREGILRADASPHAFLRNLLLETLVLRHGLEVDVQPSTPVPLHLNGRYWGLYRWMPAKDAEWLRHISGAEAVDVLEGPATVALSGKDTHFREAQRALLGSVSADSIDALIDTGSLIELACIDLWTGRADHDLNVRCYRPRERGGRWRWVLFDMDLWAPATDNSVERMCSAPVPETPYVPHLLAHPELRPRLLARLTALNAVVFAAPSTARIADSLFHAHEQELLADHRRWQLELEPPGPRASLVEMQGFLAQRPGHLLRHLAERTGHKLRTVMIEAPPAEVGRLLIEGLALPPGRHLIRCFDGVPVRLEAEAAPGHEFAGWRGASAGSPVIVEDLGRSRNLRPVFRSLVP